MRIATVIMLLALACTLPRTYAQAPQLTGTYVGSDGGVYYVQQSDKQVWWAGMSMDANTTVQWHRGLAFTNVFRGTFSDANTVSGEWVNVSRGWALSSGTLTFTISTDDTGNLTLVRTAATGDLKATGWSKTSVLNDTVYSLFQRFDEVSKNDDSGSLHDNLKPYRDATVFYGRVVNSHVDYIADNHPVESEIPHVNYGTPYEVNPIPNPVCTDCLFAGIPSYLNFGQEDRDVNSFFANAAEGDGDFDVRLKIDLNKLEPDFYTTGWGDRLFGPTVFSLKLNDASTHTKLNYSATEAYMGSETIMYGKHDASATSLMPGWADADSNSVLINGRPINGGVKDPTSTTADPCYFLQPCPYLAGETPAQLVQNYLVTDAGIRLGQLLESAYGDGVIDSTGNVAEGLGTYVRVTGALILDCGHFINVELGDTCFDDHPYVDPDDVSTHQNQEIHPVYSIDIIPPPFRPEDADVTARNNLTGTWAGPDGSTYYVRQIGNTVWWLGMLRDRQPAQPGTSFDMIGTPQVSAAALLFGTPDCVIGTECWMFASVMKGTITEHEDGSATIQGDWAGVPQSTSPGSTGGSVTLTVDAKRKVITPVTLAGFFPTLQKLYEPEDKIAPESGLLIGSPQYTNGTDQLFVNGNTPLTAFAVDQGSGVQNLWYRYFASGATPPAYTPAVGSTVTFKLTGADGEDQVDSYATDNAGNDEAPNSKTLYLDATAPVATITSPLAKQYARSDPLLLSYSVSDGSGSGVLSFTPKLDGYTAAQIGTSLDSGQTIYLYSMDPGSHTFAVDTADNLNNTGTNTVNFTITVTLASTATDVANLTAFGCIDSISQSLTAKIGAALNAYNKGQIQTAINILQATIYEVQAQGGIHISTTCKDPNGVSFNAVHVLLGDLQYLLGSLAGQLKPNPITGSVVSGSGPLNGATVNLLSGAKTVVASTPTDAFGFYYFADVRGLAASFNYAVTVVLPKGFKYSSPASVNFTWTGNPITGNFIVQ